MSVLLFCTAEEAKPFIHKIMSVEQSKNVWCFALVESRDYLKEGGYFETNVDEGATIVTDFIGASEEDCRTWAQEQWQRTNTVDNEMIAIADERTAVDHTISMQHFNDNSDMMEFEGYGKLPAENETWYTFRVEYKYSFPIVAALSEGAFDVVYPNYFGRKEELTDANGVFDVMKAEELDTE